MNTRKTVGHLALIVAIRCAAEIAINPIGDFPLNDDWAWGRTVQALLDTGDFHPTGWGPMSLLSHVLWGALFCLPAGFSFNALRLASYVASLAAASGCYLLTLEAGGSRALAVIVTLTWLFNPITFALSATFMTDVPFAACAVFAALFFARHLRDGSDRALIVATMCAMVAILSRQLALVLPVAFAVALLARRGVRRESIGRAVLPTAACYTVLTLYEQWLIASARVPALYRPLTVGFLYAVTHRHATPGDLAMRAWLVTLYVGCLALPLLLSIAALVDARRIGAVGRVGALIAGLAILVCSAIGLRAGHLLMPLTGNIIVAQGIGPLAMRDTYLLHLPNVAPLPAIFWALVTLLSVLGAVLFVAGGVVSVERLGRALTRRELDGARASGLFFLLCAAGFAVPIFAEGFLDRYLMPSLLFVAVAFAALIPQQSTTTNLSYRLALPAMLLLLCAGFSIAATRDYLTWNRARWTLLREITSDGATPRQIDGGFEFNGWHLYDPSYVATPDKSWWWVDRDEFVVAFGPIPGWNIVRERTFSRWLGAGKGRVVLLARAR